jgi:hypothetical protein
MSQVLSEITNDPTTKLPTFIVFTSAPIFSTTPTYSCPMTLTTGSGSYDCYPWSDEKPALKSQIRR